MRRTWISGRSPLTQGDVNSFIRAAQSRPRERKPWSPEGLKHHLKLRNPWRWRRLQSDVKWMKKELAKAGVDPEEFRCLL